MLVSLYCCTVMHGEQNIKFGNTDIYSGDTWCAGWLGCMLRFVMTMFISSLQLLTVYLDTEL
jgi:hypothetical protein